MGATVAETLTRRGGGGRDCSSVPLVPRKGLESFPSLEMEMLVASAINVGRAC